MFVLWFEFLRVEELGQVLLDLLSGDVQDPVRGEWRLLESRGIDVECRCFHARRDRGKLRIRSGVRLQLVRRWLVRRLAQAIAHSFLCRGPRSLTPELLWIVRLRWLELAAQQEAKDEPEAEIGLWHDEYGQSVVWVVACRRWDVEPERLVDSRAGRIDDAEEGPKLSRIGSRIELIDRYRLGLQRSRRAHDRESLRLLCSSCANVDPGNRDGYQPVVKATQRQLKREVKVDLIALRRVLSVLRSQAEVRLHERLEEFHGNGDLVIRRRPVHILNLHDEEARQGVDDIWRIVEQDLLIPLGVDVALNH